MRRALHRAGRAPRRRSDHEEDDNDGRAAGATAREQQRHQQDRERDQPGARLQRTASPPAQRPRMTCQRLRQRHRRNEERRGPRERSRHGARSTSGSSGHHDQHLVRRPDEDERPHPEPGERERRWRDGREALLASSTAQPANAAANSESLASWWNRIP